MLMLNLHTFLPKKKYSFLKIIARDVKKQEEAMVFNNYILL